VSFFVQIDCKAYNKYWFTLMPCRDMRLRLKKYIEESQADNERKKNPLYFQEAHGSVKEVVGSGSDVECRMGASV